MDEEPKPAADVVPAVRSQVFEYEDPFVDEHEPAIADQLAMMAELGALYYDGVPGLQRKRRSTIDHANPATAAMLDRLPSFGEWLSRVPSAAALDPLYDPSRGTFASGERIDQDTLSWMRNIADARGLRSRAAVVGQVLADDARAAGLPQKWLSLSSGAAHPVLGAMRALHDEHGPVPHVTHVDLDRRALHRARDDADGHGLQAGTNVVRANVLTPQGLAVRSGRRGTRVRTGWVEAFETVEAVGILEYLQPDAWTYTYAGPISTGRTTAGAVTFCRNAYACVKPGGLFVVGNMLSTHPQLGFTLDVVQWPHIQPRSVAQTLDIFHAAGIDGHVDVYLPTDGVYAVYAIRKPEVVGCPPTR